MNALFVHQNFPAQFRNLAVHLAAMPENRVVAIGAETARGLPGVALQRYEVAPSDPRAVHPFARCFDDECRRAEQVLYVATDLVASGFVPDVVVAHCGWGESLPLRTAFPSARIVAYAEFFYAPRGLDVGFDPEADALSLDGAVALRARNAATLLALAEADVAVSPTEWQRSTFPAAVRHLIQVCHEGIDVDVAKPSPDAVVSLGDGTVLRPGDEVVTFVARNLEPLRGFRVFMRALPEVLRRRPRARVLVVGGDGVSYGAEPPSDRTWRGLMLDEIGGAPGIDRVHFLGRLDHAAYLDVLRVSAAHVYLTYPFVLSWSLLEAMAAGCLVIASATGPVLDVVDGSNGVLVGFFDVAGLSDGVVEALAKPNGFASRRRAARRTVVDRYRRQDCTARMIEIMVRGRQG